ncbi:MAG: diacylglycerol kinase family protein [Pirellula sp.]|nr:diacylglycerol kinase family protein [Pirellula sp.]
MKDECSGKFSWAKRYQSFVHAFRGFSKLIVTEHNARIHAVVTLGVIVAGMSLGVSRDDWCWLMLAMGLVWMTEAFNTCLESLADAITLEYHPAIRDAKDVAATAVLIASVLAAGIGICRFAPHLVKWIF